MQNGAQGGDLKAGGPPEEVLQGSSQEAKPFAAPPRVLPRCPGGSLADPHRDKKAAPHLTARLIPL